MVSLWPSSTGVSPTDCFTSQEPLTILGMSLRERSNGCVNIDSLSFCAVSGAQAGLMQSRWAGSSKTGRGCQKEPKLT